MAWVFYCCAVPILKSNLSSNRMWRILTRCCKTSLMLLSSCSVAPPPRPVLMYPDYPASPFHPRPKLHEEGLHQMFLDFPDAPIFMQRSAHSTARPDVSRLPGVFSPRSLSVKTFWDLEHLAKYRFQHSNFLHF